ncbi:hypothetical protein GCM10010508_47340 [Streptomyces naganishii JCM 4654]|uniref:Uncharacterized protein n=1 Tax=Streptomyces naganishii JCM 4654 TaxID=1306179 RepID=A0A918Y6R2_9ACTN|nr:hypothetical protein GCM10010508_47340 [Streptomyces naganishii JCM 4654]
MAWSCTAGVLSIRKSPLEGGIRGSPWRPNISKINVDKQAELSVSVPSDPLLDVRITQLQGVWMARPHVVTPQAGLTR